MPTHDPTPDQATLQETLEQRARQALTRAWTCQPELPPGLLSVLRVWHSPAFDPQRSWTVFQSRNPSPPQVFLIRRVEWDREADVERFSVPLTLPQRAKLHRSSGPALTVTDGEVPAREWELLMAEAPRLELPVHLPLEEFASTDSERFGIERRMLALSLSVEWANEPPAIWSELAAWTARVRALLETRVSTGKR